MKSLVSQERRLLGTLSCSDKSGVSVYISSRTSDWLTESCTHTHTHTQMYWLICLLIWNTAVTDHCAPVTTQAAPIASGKKKRTFHWTSDQSDLACLTLDDPDVMTICFHYQTTAKCLAWNSTAHSTLGRAQDAELYAVCTDQHVNGLFVKSP